MFLKQNQIRKISEVTECFQSSKCFSSKQFRDSALIHLSGKKWLGIALKPCDRTISLILIKRHQKLGSSNKLFEIKALL